MFWKRISIRLPDREIGEITHEPWRILYRSGGPFANLISNRYY